MKLLCITENFADELRFLEDEGFGKLMTREEMRKVGNAKSLGFTPQNVFFKPSPLTVDRTFLHKVRSREITYEFYVSQFRREVDKNLVKVARKFHPNTDDLMLSLESDTGKFNNKYS